MLPRRQTLDHLAGRVFALAVKAPESVLRSLDLHRKRTCLPPVLACGNSSDVAEHGYRLRLGAVPAVDIQEIDTPVSNRNDLRGIAARKGPLHALYKPPGVLGTINIDGHCPHMLSVYSLQLRYGVLRDGKLVVKRSIPTGDIREGDRMLPGHDAAN